MEINDFDVAKIELNRGSHLIEASAGTGKTYTIAMLVLRFIAEQGVPIENVLVVTFTNAATAELKERVRLRLLEGLQALFGGTEGVDNNVVCWAENLNTEKLKARQRLEQALLNIDQAAIFTIHGFCQRALKEFALESGQLFDSELTGDISQLRLQIAEDYWREHVYPRPIWAVSVLTQAFKSPQELLQSIADVPVRGEVYPELLALEPILNTIEQSFEMAKTLLPKVFQVLGEPQNAEMFKPAYAVALQDNYQNLFDWLTLQNTPLPEMALAAFTGAGIKQGLNGNKFRAKGGVSGEQRKQAFLQQSGIDTSYFEQLQQAIKSAQLLFRRNLVERLRTQQDQKLQQLNQLSFDNLIYRLSEALQEPENELLKTGLQQRYRVALIDEFQDTDQDQWHIFWTLFNNPEHNLYLIGDPKQAIYKFRGADVFSYFQASQKAQYHFSLSNNWRSHPDLVEAVNRLFDGRMQPFWLPQLQFHQSRAGLEADKTGLRRKGNPMVPMVLWQLDENPETEQGHWGIGDAARALRMAVVNEIVELLDEDNPVTVISDQGGIALQPEDIAILVRTNSQAREYQIELANAGVPSVLNSTESVFDTNEAKELYRLLQAIAQPGNLVFLKQAMTLSWFDLTGQDLYALVNDEHLLDPWLTRFQGYFQVWQSQGLMAMMHQLLSAEAVEVNLAKSPVAERKLTNIHHLVELLQQAVVEQHLGLPKTLEWLQTSINDESASDEKQLRLESDEQAVKIVTMHRCKGLEYPVVFCPTLWHRSARLTREKSLVRCHENGEMITDLGSEQYGVRQNQAIMEELSEDLRLLYVAVTRAKNRCYLAWVNVRTKNFPNISALSYLLFSQKTEGWQQDVADVNFLDQQRVLQALSEYTPNSFDYRLLAPEQELNQYYLMHESTVALSARQRQRSLSSTWRMTSYTALSALSIEETTEMPTDKAQEPVSETLLAEAPTEGLPRGAHTGNVVHQLLENLAFAKLAQAEDISTARDLACRRYGLRLEQPGVIDQLLNKVVQTPLIDSDPHFYLANLAPHLCLKELPFFYAFDAINSADINSILVDRPDYRPLSGREMQGFLTGFIDLICQYQGKFYLMDYKTNFLQNYHQDALTASMREHNYGLQYWIYSLVLHQYLTKRLPGYSYHQHFGGVHYLFVRGMVPEQPGSGVYSTLPDLPTLERLMNFFKA